MTVYQEPGTERTVDVDETSGELLTWLGWTRVSAPEPEPEPEPEPVEAEGRRGAPRADDLIGE